eukprot:117823-Chlamydomonas_euryale.AAC.1
MGLVRQAVQGRGGARGRSAATVVSGTPSGHPPARGARHAPALCAVRAECTCRSGGPALCTRQETAG